MMDPVAIKVTQLLKKPISCHSWSKDGQRLAVCPNNETVLIYRREGGDSENWTLEATLAEHDQLITAMDWYSDVRGEHLLTVSSDRNGYVWDRLPGAGTAWKPTLVLLRLRRAANCVRWSPDGRKFAVGGAEGIISIGYYEAENDWWICKHLKSSLDGSPILAVAWHPSGKLLAASSLAGNVQILGTCLKQVDGKSPSNVQDPTWVSDPTLLKDNFDKLLGSLVYGCWIHSLGFAPSGNTLAMAAHDGHVYIMDFALQEQFAIPTASEDLLPLRRILFVSETSLICTGFGGEFPFLLVKSDAWRLEGTLKPNSAGGSSKCGSVKTPESPSESKLPGSLKVSTSKAFGGALAKFKALDSQGLTIRNTETTDQDDDPSGTARKTSYALFKASASAAPHRNTISEIRLLPDGRLASTGYDGALVTWQLAPLLARIGVANL